MSDLVERTAVQKLGEAPPAVAGVASDRALRVERRMAGVTLVVAIGVLLGVPVVEAVAKTRLYPSTRIVEMGSVPQGRRAPAQVRLWNLTLSPVNVLSATGSCGCTLAHVDKPTIGPLSSTVVRLELDTSSLELGPFSKTASLEVEPLAKEAVKVVLRGKVVVSEGDEKRK